MIDYSNYWEASSKTFETAQESISFAPIVLSKKLLVLSSIFLILIILNVVVALRVSMLNYNISNQEKLLKNLQIEKTALLNKADTLMSADKELQEANKFGLKPVNTDQIRFYQ
jgi:cell division protein FtsL